MILLIDQYIDLTIVVMRIFLDAQDDYYISNYSLSSECFINDTNTVIYALLFYYIYEHFGHFDKIFDLLNKNLFSIENNEKRNLPTASTFYSKQVILLCSFSKASFLSARQSL